MVVLGLLLSLAPGCFDPLFEDLGPLVKPIVEPSPDAGPGDGDLGGWVVCCESFQVSTCPCTEPAGCTVSLKACAGGTCAPAGATCGGGTGDGGATVQLDAGVSAGDAGLDAGAADGGNADGGLALDGGGAVDGGAPEQDAGVPGPTEFELCCDGTGHVNTCGCPSTGCQGQVFTACRQNTCVQGSARCP